MIARECGLEVGEFIHTISDAHIYSNHFEQVNLQISREEDIRELPTLWLNPEVTSVFDFTMDDIKVENYNPHSGIKAPVAV
jgi:thymidylate synthase